jgi:methylmalonyl-CoA carboxyltransferase small subunit
VKLKITVDGKTYEVDVEATEPEPRAPAHIPALAPPRATVAPVAPVAAAPQADGAPVADEGKVCRSPISGTVVRVTAQPGQAMQVGDVLLVLEAMKMETNITAPIAAKVARIDAKVGDAVRTGQVVVAFD